MLLPLLRLLVLALLADQQYTGVPVAPLSALSVGAWTLGTPGHSLT